MLLESLEAAINTHIYIILNCLKPTEPTLKTRNGEAKVLADGKPITRSGPAKEKDDLGEEEIVTEGRSLDPTLCFSMLWVWFCCPSELKIAR